MRQTDGVVGQAFGNEVPPSDHARALHAAVHELIDQFCEDVASLVDAPQKRWRNINEPVPTALLSGKI
jgi:hypothetical protein